MHIGVSIAVDAICKLSKRVMQLNLAPQFAVNEETWPPYQLKFYVPLLLMHYKDQRNLMQANAVAELIAAGKVDDIPSMVSDQLVPIHYCKEDNSHKSLSQAFNNSTVTKEIAEILAPLENEYPSRFILIEGPPGVGKSVLLKEISYRWANKQLLQTYKLVLLICLRDPMVQQAESIDDLLQLYCKGDKRASEIVSASCDQLFNSGGKELTLLLDGYDELPEKLQKSGLIADILRRETLPHCGLVLSSRPHASKKFHNKATLMVEVLGFTEEEKRLCIEQAHQRNPQKLKEFSQYLRNHLCINSLCYLPFNMIVLLFLYDQGIPLPKNHSEMYHHFIFLAICQHLAKSGHPLTYTNTITDLNSLPEPCGKIIEQLAALSLQAVDRNKLIFTLDEIKVVCPDIEDIPGAINGFGLLQAVQHIGLTGKTLTFNFIHFTIQEYLAAYYITKLSPYEELQILKDKFWHVNYFNTFSFYVAITKGQRPSFKEFLSDGNKMVKISKRFLDDIDFCLHLYHCFYEAGDEKMCGSIARAEVFNDTIIENIKANSPNEIECLSLFLTTSHHQTWTKVNFGFNHIQDYGLHILYRGLKGSGINITELCLWHNGLTSSSSALVSNIVISCRVKRLVLDGNETVGENEQLYSMLSHPSTKLEILSMFKTKLSSGAADILFTTLEQNNTLKMLSIEHNDITDDVCPYIANAIKLNSSIVKLWMRFNQISAKAIRTIIQALHYNDTLEKLLLPNYSDDVKRDIKLTEKDINETRERRGSYVKLFIDFNTMIYTKLFIQ